MTQETIDEEMARIDKEVRNTLLACIPLSILALAIPILAIFGVFKPSNELLNIWFQRSGSMMVLFAVWMEYNLSKISEHINLSGLSVGEQIDLSNKYKSKFTLAKYTGALLAICGTIIWGYGDLLLNR